MKSGKIEGSEVVSFAGLTTEIIAGDDGKVTVMRMRVTPKFGAPPHISYDEDKIFLVSTGTLRFTVQDSTSDVRAGGLVAVKGGDVHGFVNLQESDAIQLLVSTPARHHDFFRAMAALGADYDPADLEAVFDVPVQVSAVLGRSKMDVGELLKLGPGTVLELDRRVGEAIDIYVNNRLVARGEVVLVEDKLGVTMTEIIKADRS